MSGFVDLTKDHCSRGVQGVDELKRLIDDYFVEIIDLVYSFGGDVLYIAGDAILCVFEAESSCERAAACSNALVHHCFPQMKLHVALAFGDMRLSVLGGAGVMTFVVTGTPLVEMFASISEAGADEVIVSPAFKDEVLATQLHRRMEIELEETPSGRFKLRVLRTYVVHDPIFPRSEFKLDKGTADVAKSFVPSLVAQVIGGYELDQCFTELRRVSSLFLRLDSYDEAADDSPPYLHEFFGTLQRTLQETGGFMRQFLMDDKGLIMIAMWGVPSHSYANNALKALECGLLAKSRCHEIGLAVSIGISTGLIFCGIVGADTRRDYVGIGDHVNFAARLMGVAEGRLLIDENTYAALPKAAQSCLKKSAPLTLKGFEQPIIPFEALEDFKLIISAKQDVRGVSKWEEVTNFCAEKIDEISMIDWNSEPVALKRNKFRRGIMSKSPHVSFAIVIGAQGLGFYDIPLYITKYASRTHPGMQCYLISADSNDSRVQYSGISKLLRAAFGDDMQSKLQYQVTNTFCDLSSKEQLSRLIALRNILHLTEVGDEDTIAETIETGNQPRGLRAIADIKFRRPNAFNIVLDIVKSLLRNNNSIIIIDNAHYIDESSWALLQSLIYLDRGAIFFYVVISPNTQVSLPADRKFSLKPKDLENKGITECYLGRKIVALDAICDLQASKLFFVSSMTSTEVRQALSDDLNTYIDANFSKTVYEVTGGDPFWVNLISSFVKEKGFKNIAHLSRGEGADSLLREIVICRFDALTPEQQVLLKDASVIGYEFSSKILKEMSNYSDGANMDTLIRDGFISCIDRSATKYRFQNELMREIIYSLIPASSVSLKHYTVAVCLEKDCGDHMSLFPQ